MVNWWWWWLSVDLLLPAVAAATPPPLARQRRVEKRERVSFLLLPFSYSLPLMDAIIYLFLKK